MTHNALLGPLIALALWTLIMLMVGAPRMLKAAKASNVKFPKGTRGRDLEGHIPAEATWGRQNYEHLVEQPTLFYAIVLALVAMGDQIAFNLYLAWGYVGLRIVHSIVQLTGGNRFLWFIGSTLCLLALVIHAGIRFIHG